MRSLPARLLPLLLLTACGGGAIYVPPPAPDLPIDPRVAFVPRPKVAPPAPKSTPIDGALPSAIEAVLERKAACAAGACSLPALVPAPLAPSTEDAAPVTIWEHLLGKGARLTVPRDAEVDLLGVVVRGAIELRTAGDKAHPAVTLWQAFRAPGAGVTIEAMTAETRVVLVLATAGEPLASAIARLATKAKDLTWKERPAPLAVIDLAAQPDLAWDGGARHARLAFEPSNSPRASLGVLLLAKDAAVPEHLHDKEWEVLAALEADGDFTLKPPAGAPAVNAMTDGAIAIAPPSVPHQWKPRGTRRMLGIQVYTPPGPEQRFKKLAGK